MDIYVQLKKRGGYMKGKNDNELELIKNFITKINNGAI